MHNFRYFILLSLFFVFPIFTFLFSLLLNDVVVFGKIFLAAFPCVFYTKDVLISLLNSKNFFFASLSIKMFHLSSESGFRELFLVFFSVQKVSRFRSENRIFFCSRVEQLKLRRSFVDRKLTFVPKVAEFDSKWFVFFSPKILFCHILVVVSVSGRQNLNFSIRTHFHFVYHVFVVSENRKCVGWVDVHYAKTPSSLP